MKDDYQIAYDRNIAIGEMFLQEFPKPKYESNISYNFNFDPNSTYVWYQGDKLDNDYFKRTSDGAEAIFTKYSHIQLK